MKFKFTFTILLLILVFSCEERETTNPFDPNCPKEIFTPSNFRAVLNGDVVRLSWDQPSNQISGFKLERKIGTSSWSSLSQLSKTALSYDDSRLESGKVHQYRITADAGGNPSNSVETQITPILEEKPTVITSTPSDVTSNSAVLGGNVTDDGNLTVTERGILYGISQDVTKKIIGSGTGEFSTIITGLNSNTTYYVRAYAINSEGEALGEQVSFTTGIVPTAGFSASATNISKGSSVQFTDESSGNPTSWSWNFGDGSSSTQQHPSHTYNSAGTYTISLTATNSYGSNTKTKTDHIIVLGDEPLANFTVSTTSPSVGNSIQFTDQSENSPTSWSWNFGDGSSSSQQNPSHTYNSTGTYSVSLTATNSYGSNTETKTDYIVVTGNPPSVITYTQINITCNSASLNGNISSDGGGTIIERGFYWSSTDQTPDSNDNKETVSGTIGSYSANISNLQENTTYYYRAFARNSVGTEEGNTYNFTTPSCTTISLPTVTTSSVSSITATSATVGGEVTDDGNASVTEKGVVYSTSSNPTTSDNKKVIGSDTGIFSAGIDGLTANTTYYLKAYAINSQGTSYGYQISFTTEAMLASVQDPTISNITTSTATFSSNVTNDGGGTVTERGFMWKQNYPDYMTNYLSTSVGSGTGSFNLNVTSLDAHADYEVKAYAVNSAGTAYSDVVTFSTPRFDVPTVSTDAVTDITANSATCGGDATSGDYGDGVENGVCWSTSPTPTYNDQKTTDSYSLGTFTSSITGLTCNTTYYVRAYSKNIEGIGYGEERSFTTGSCPQPLINEVVDDEVFDGRGIPEKGTGNGDGKINVGEDIDFRITIKNNGDAKAYNIRGVISLEWAPDANICNISSNDCELTSLDIGAEDDLNYFDFQVSGLPPDDPNDMIHFILDLTYEDASGNTYSYKFDGNKTISKRVNP